MDSVDDFLRALDSIEAAIQEFPDVVFLEMSLTRGPMTGVAGDYINRTRPQIYIMLLARRSIRANWENLCFDIGGPEFPFVWSSKRSTVYDCFPKDLANETESVDFAVWYYLDSLRCPIPQHVLDRSPPDTDDTEDCLAALVYQAEMDRAMNIMRSMKAAWNLAPEAVIREFGDLSRLPTRRVLPGDASDTLDLWWPAVLLYLAVQKVDVVLSASAHPHIPWDSIFDDLPEDGDHQACVDAFDPTTWTVSLSMPSLMAATRCALRAFRRVAEESKEMPDKFQWTPPMLEGYVIALLKEDKSPTQRSAVAWIGSRAGKPNPSTSTLRKTYSWQNRPQKTPKPGTTTEAQSGVSPAQNADAAVSHVEVTNAVLDIQAKLGRELADDERSAVEWTLENAGADEEEREEAIGQLIEGFRNAGM